MATLDEGTLIIDPGVAAPFIELCTAPPRAVFLTHEHADHIAGIPDLLSTFPDVRIFANRPHLFPNTWPIQDAQGISQCFSEPITILPTPGHSFASACLILEKQASAFVGDTLFSMGCGRAFTQNYSLFFQSLQSIARLPPNTRLYWGHNYALTNYHFTKKVLSNKKLKEYAQHMHTVGTGAFLRDERLFNPFLQARNTLDFQRLRDKRDQLNPAMQ